MATDPYEALQDDLEAMCIANAGLLVEVAELTAIVESVRKARERIERRVTVFHRAWSETDDETCRVRATAFHEAVEMLNKVDGL